MDYLFYFFDILIFIAVVLLVEGTYLSWNSEKGPEAARVARRLRVMSAGNYGGDAGGSILKKRLLSKTPWMQRTLLQVPRVNSLDRLLHQSGLSWSVSEFFGIAAIVFFLVFFVCSYVGLPMWSRFVFAVVGIVLPLAYVIRAKAKRLIRIEEQLPDAMDLIGRALRAGHAFPTGLKMVGDEMTDPLASEFRTLFDEVNFGISMQEALMNLATRVPSTDVRYFVIAVLIQRETGGNLTELLGSISAIIRDRIKLLGQVRVLSAEGKLSAWILTLLPFVAALAIQLTNSAFIEVLYTAPVGRKMLAAAGVLMLLGILAMRKIIQIRV